MMPSRVGLHKAQILAILNATNQALTLKQIVKYMDVGIPRMWDMLRIMVADGSVHITRGHESTRHYRPGPGKTDAPPTTAARILQALADGPMTSQQLGDRLGVSKGHIGHTINDKLRAKGQPKLVYIAKFGKNGHARINIYAAGSRSDAKPPAPMTHAEKNRRRYKKLRADKDRLHDFQVRDRLRKIKPKADPILSQFAGLFSANDRQETA